MQKEDKSILKLNMFMMIILVLSLFAAVIKLFVGFDIDEAYAVSMPYRLLQGDYLFLDMWEVHQTSSILPAFFIAIYKMFVPKLTGIVLYLRVVATLIHGGISFLLYVFMKKRMKQAHAFLVGIIYFNFLPKWMINLDFSMQQLWFFTLTLICLYTAMYEKVNSKLWYTMCGVCLAAAVLAYPGMVFLYPAFISIILKNKSKFNNVISLTCGCAIMAIIFLGAIWLHMPFQEFMKAIPMVFFRRLTPV